MQIAILDWVSLRHTHVMTVEYIWVRPKERLSRSLKFIPLIRQLALSLPKEFAEKPGLLLPIGLRPNLCLLLVSFSDLSLDVLL